MKQATIICPGPSAKWEDIQDGPVLAINSALGLCERADYWVAIDNPKPMHGHCREAAERLKPALVVYDGNTHGWVEAFPDLQLWPVWKSHTIDIKTMTQHWIRDATPRLLTIWMAIWWAVEGCGATAIEIVGCDMAGDGYWDESVPKNTGGHPHDWEHERREMAAVIEMAAKHGVTITRREKVRA